MKKFAFPLERVLDFRRTQARVEEIRLEQLNTEIRGIEARQAALDAQRRGSETAVLSGPGATGLELAELDRFRRFVSAERSRLERQRSDCAGRIAAQIQAVAQKRRDVRLLERLRDRALSSWKVELGREIEAQAEEAHRARRR